MTAAVRDFRGSAGHERYIEIALARVGGRDPSVLLTSEPLANPGSGEQRWIRIVEVQIGHNVVSPSVSDEFWRQLLDAESGADAKYRITPGFSAPRVARGLRPERDALSITESRRSTTTR